MKQRLTDEIKGLFNDRQRQVVQTRSFATFETFNNYIELVNFHKIKTWRDENVICVRYSLKDLHTGVILLPKLGPTFAKYRQNLFAISWESLIVTSWVCIDEMLIGLRFAWFITQFRIFHVDLTSFLFLESIDSWYCFLANLKSRGWRRRWIIPSWIRQRK